MKQTMAVANLDAEKLAIEKMKEKDKVRSLVVSSLHGYGSIMSDVHLSHQRNTSDTSFVSQYKLIVKGDKLLATHIYIPRRTILCI